MAQIDSPQITVSEELFLSLVRENPELRLERSKDGTLTVVPPAGGESSRQNIRLTTQLEIWNERLNAGVAFDSSAGFHLQMGATYSPDAAWIEKRRWQELTPEQRRLFVPFARIL